MLLYQTDAVEALVMIYFIQDKSLSKAREHTNNGVVKKGNLFIKHCLINNSIMAFKIQKQFAVFVNKVFANILE